MPSDQKEAKCPFCASHVQKRDVSGGRTELKIPFTDPPWRIPIPPIVAKILKPSPDKCTCEGKQKIKDASNKTEKYQQVKQQAQSDIQKTIDLEAKLGTGGSRTTMIEKSDTLFVGLGFNKNSSYDIVPESHLSPGSISADPETGAAFAKGFKSNSVEGVQTSIGWPQAVGNYKIICANSFNVLAGAGGINFNTKGPLTFNSGILNLTGPQVNVGSSSGPLTLEGDVVSITGKTISLTPTDANVFVKGTVSATGNMLVGGQLHAENLSFCKASCPGKDAQTTATAANPANSQTHGASWGGAAVKGITTSILDITAYVGNGVTDFETAAAYFLSPTQVLNLVNRMGVLAKSIIPLETTITGIAWFGAVPLPVQNFPHQHGLPSQNHTHGIRIPDIDCKDYSTPQSVRAAVMNDSLTSNAPVVPKTTIQDSLKYFQALPGFIANAGLQMQKLMRWMIQIFS